MAATTLTTCIETGRGAVADAYNLGYADGVDSATVSLNAKVKRLEVQLADADAAIRRMVNEDA